MMESWEKEKDLDKNKGTEIPRWGLTFPVGFSTD